MNNADVVTCGETVNHALANLKDSPDVDGSAAFFPKIADSLPLEQLHYEKWLALLGHIIVEHADSSRMIDQVRYISFAEKAVIDDFFSRELCVKDFQRSALPVAMRRPKDSRHPANTKEGFDAPLAPNDGANARGMAFIGRWNRGLYRFDHVHFTVRR